jgi:hypothetical protein
LKYLFLLSLFGFVLALLYWRLRPYIRMLRQAFGVAREVRRAMTAGPQNTMPRQRAAGEIKLVQCASCHTWVPQARAITVGASRSSYCSHGCLERASIPRRA